MALKSTIFKAQVAVADIDHAYYADHQLTAIGVGHLQIGGDLAKRQERRSGVPGLGGGDKLLSLVPHILALICCRDDSLGRSFDMVLPVSRNGHSGDPAYPLRYRFIAAARADHLGCHTYLCGIGAD